MGVFKFPFGLIDDLEKIIRDFWWGDEQNRNKMHWLSWNKLTRPKCHGGVGFRDLRVFSTRPYQLVRLGVCCSLRIASVLGC
jgi:hypothetical protein